MRLSGCCSGGLGVCGRLHIRGGRSRLWRLEIRDWRLDRSISNLQSPILDGLLSLLEESLLRVVSDEAEPRVAMLETIREYALERRRPALRAAQACIAQFLQPVSHHAFETL